MSDMENLLPYAAPSEPRVVGALTEALNVYGGVGLDFVHYASN